MSQHMDALARANEVRLARAALKRQIATGGTTVARVLADPPPELDRMPVFDLLDAQNRWGSQRCRRFLRTLGISELRPVGGLTVRERDLIARRLHMTPSEMRLAA